MINISIIGASGYTGAELIRLALLHPKITIKNLVADSNAGKHIEELYPAYSGNNLPKLKKLDEIDLNDSDVIFCCLPHRKTHEIIKNIPENKIIIDLSADFRLADSDIYEKWYQVEHLAKDYQEKAVYGLSEIYRDEIKNSNLIACPGCYPTSALLPLIPLLEKNLISFNNIIISSISGITGAGRAAKQAHLYAEIAGGAWGYGIGHHRHMAEIEQELGKANNNEVIVNFTPHIAPMNRGILSTIYVELKNGSNIDDLKQALNEKYKNEHFVSVQDKAPSTREVYSTNNCKIAVFADRLKNRAIIISAIDNLTKGSSGQAIQNMNIRLGLEENLGLNLQPVYP